MIQIGIERIEQIYHQSGWITDVRVLSSIKTEFPGDIKLFEYLKEGLTNLQGNTNSIGYAFKIRIKFIGEQDNIFYSFASSDKDPKTHIQNLINYYEIQIQF